jgi:hypothetical protein
MTPRAANKSDLFTFLKTWHNPLMTKKHDDRAKSPAGFVIGREGFAKISAVEGIRLSKKMMNRARQADRDGLTDEERREAIIRAHRRT